MYITCIAPMFSKPEEENKGTTPIFSK